MPPGGAPKPPGGAPKPPAGAPEPPASTPKPADAATKPRQRRGAKPKTAGPHPAAGTTHEASPKPAPDQALAAEVEEAAPATEKAVPATRETAPPAIASEPRDAGPLARPSESRAHPTSETAPSEAFDDDAPLAAPWVAVHPGTSAPESPTVPAESEPPAATGRQAPAADSTGEPTDAATEAAPVVDRPPATRIRRRDAALLLVALVITIGALTVARIGITGPPESFTQLWLQGGTADAPLMVGVESHESTTVAYRLDLVVNGGLRSSSKFQLDPGAQRLIPTPKLVPGSVFEARLALQSKPGQVYRRVLLHVPTPTPTPKPSA